MQQSTETNDTLKLRLVSKRLYIETRVNLVDGQNPHSMDSPNGLPL